MSGHVPTVIAIAYVVCSIATFVAYAWDKAAARDRRSRIPERTLHLLSLLGGWPGALVAQRLVRHKTRKLPFQVVFWLTVLGNLAVAGWLLGAPEVWVG